MQNRATLWPNLQAKAVEKFEDQSIYTFGISHRQGPSSTMILLTQEIWWCFLLLSILIILFFVAKNIVVVYERLDISIKATIMMSTIGMANWLPFYAKKKLCIIQKGSSH